MATWPVVIYLARVFSQHTASTERTVQYVTVMKLRRIAYLLRNDMLVGFQQRHGWSVNFIVIATPSGCEC